MLKQKVVFRKPPLPFAKNKKIYNPPESMSWQVAKTILAIMIAAIIVIIIIIVTF